MRLNIGDRVKRIFCDNPNDRAIQIGMTGTVNSGNADGSCQACVTWDGHEDNEAMSRQGCDITRLEVLERTKLTSAEVQRQIDKALYTKPTNPKDRAATHRLDLSLYPQSAIAYGALGMTEGDCKYAGYNYRESGVGISTYVAAAMRHLFKYYNGEWADPKTKVPHLASFLACGAILVDGHEQGNMNDDRPPKQNMDKILTEFEAITKHLHEIFPNGPERVTELTIKR